jgi:hypothetical protein
MRESIQTLWDLLKDAVTGGPEPGKPPERRARPPSRKQPEAPGRPRSRVRAEERPGQRNPKTAMAERYEEITRQMLQLHGVRVRRWRNSMSGLAWQIQYQDGRIAKLIESPRPRGPMSAAVFLHEIGHHAIGFNVYKPRCLEEYHAWVYSLQQMEALGLNITDSVRCRMHQSLRYAVQKAQRRGIKELPLELLPYTKPWKAPGGSTPGRKRTRNQVR